MIEQTRKNHEDFKSYVEKLTKLIGSSTGDVHYNFTSDTSFSSEVALDELLKKHEEKEEFHVHHVWKSESKELTLSVEFKKGEVNFELHVRRNSNGARVYGLTHWGSYTDEQLKQAAKAFLSIGSISGGVTDMNKVKS